MHKLVKIVLCSDNVLYPASERIGDYTGLVFDTQTKVVYYMLKEFHGFSGSSNYSGYMAPYISENGKYCRFIDNQIVEIG